MSAAHAQLYVRCENDGNIGTLKYRTQSYNGAIGGAAGCPGGACDVEEQPEQSIVCVSSDTYPIYVNFKEDDKYEEDQTVGLVLTRSIGSNIVPFAGVAARMTIQDDGDGTWDARMQERGCGDEVCVCVGGGGTFQGPSRHQLDVLPVRVFARDCVLRFTIFCVLMERGPSVLVGATPLSRGI